MTKEKFLAKVEKLFAKVKGELTKEDLEGILLEPEIDEKEHPAEQVEETPIKEEEAIPEVKEEIEEATPEEIEVKEVEEEVKEDVPPANEDDGTRAKMQVLEDKISELRTANDGLVARIGALEELVKSISVPVANKDFGVPSQGNVEYPQEESDHKEFMNKHGKYI